MKENAKYAGTYQVRVGDINYGGHMGNDKALLLFHDARLFFLEELGFSEINIGGPGIIISDAHVYFKKEVFKGDELKAYIHIEELKSISFVMHYTIFRHEVEVMNGNTRLIAFDYEGRRVAKLPKAFIEKITS